MIHALKSARHPNILAIATRTLYISVRGPPNRAGFATAFWCSFNPYHVR